MVALEAADFFFKLLSSIAYRVLLVVYGWIICAFYGYHYPLDYYFIGTVIYVIVSAFLFPRTHRHGYFTLFLDFAFIYMFVNGKPIETILVLSYVYIPIVNSPNHTGKSRGMSIYVYTVLLIYLLAGKEQVVFASIAIIPFAILGCLEYIRSRMNKINDKIYDVIDESYQANLHINKTHKVYRDIIASLNSSMGKYLKLADIFCLSKKGNRLLIVNTSRYVYDIEIEDKDSFLSKIDKEKAVYNHKIMADNEPIGSNVCLAYDVPDQTYVFIMSFAKIGNFFWAHVLTRYILKVVFTRVVWVLQVEQQLKDMQKAQAEKLKENIEYFESAADAMHFVNNKLSPLKTLTRVVDNYKKETNPRVRGKYFDLLGKTRDRAEVSLSLIEEQAKKILSVKNKMIFEEMKKVSIGRIFSIVRKSWNQEFDEESFDINWSKEKFELDINLNEQGFYFVVDNILTNMRKHQKEVAEVGFFEYGNRFLIRFRNDFEEERSVVERVATNFMSEESQEIDMRRSHGLNMTRRFLKQMGLGYSVYVDGEFFVFELILGEAH